MSKLTYVEQAERWFGEASSESSAQIMATLAIAEAIQAQTEQLKRIADSLAGIQDSLYRKGEEVVGVVDMLEIINDTLCKD